MTQGTGKELCRTIRKDILRISKISGHGHIPTCYSIVEILVALYSVAKHDPADPKWEERDIVILSKGHAALALYTALARHGYFDISQVDTFGAFGTAFGCHANRLKVPGVEVSTGSLGHGIPLAVGMALALKIKKSPRKVFVIVGDGESNEGSVWEAAMVAEDLGLDNLTVIYDDNRSHPRGLQILNPGEKLGAFGFKVVEAQGHDLDALRSAFAAPTKGKPKAIIAKTVKGRGSRTMSADVYAWHRRSPNETEYEAIMKELDEETV